MIAETPLFIKTEKAYEPNITLDKPTHHTHEVIFMLKRLSVRYGSQGFFKQVALIPLETKIPIILTSGPFEVTEILGYDTVQECVYYMIAPERKPGQRHLYKVNLTLQSNNDHININSKQVSPLCLSCNWLFDSLNNTRNHTRFENNITTNNCLYNRIFFNPDFTYYIQECLGPQSPSSYVVKTAFQEKVFVLDNGNHLKHLLNELSKPQIMTFSVQIKYEFHAQVRMYLPSGIKEDDDAQLPLILHVYV